MMEMVRKHKNSRKYLRKLSTGKQEELNHELAPINTAKEMSQKAKSEVLKNFKLTWKENLSWLVPTTNQ